MHVMILAFLVLLTAAAKGVQITRLSMPRWVQNGTEDSVVLDCEYSYDEEEDRRLVVKWFLNDDPLPIYQWIPELNQRFASERVRGKLNMDYAVHPSSRLTRYRALNLMRPTTELSGRYSCHVVSLKGQDVEDQVMVVYAPPRTFDFNYTRTSPTTSTFTCEVDGVFPLPKITLSMSQSPALSQDPAAASQDLISGSSVETVVTTTGGDGGSSSAGSFKVRVTRTVRDWEVTVGGVTGDSRAAVFECVLSIPGTDYENMRRVLYLPGSISGTWRPRQAGVFVFCVFCLVVFICS